MGAVAYPGPVPEASSPSVVLIGTFQDACPLQRPRHPSVPGAWRRSRWGQEGLLAGCGQKMVAEANWLVWRPSVCCTAAHTPAPSCVPVHSQAELEATQRQLRDADAANRQNATQPAACTCPVPVASPPPAAVPEAANRQDTLAAAAAAAVSRHTGSQAAPAWGLPALRVVSEGRERFAVLLCGSSSLDSLRCHWAAVLLFSSAQRPRLLPPCPSDDHHHGVGLCAGCGHSLPGHPTQ